MTGIVFRNAVPDDQDFIVDGILDICRIEKESPTDNLKRSLSHAVKDGRVKIAYSGKKKVGFVQYAFTDKVPYGVGYGRMDSTICWVEWLFVARGSRRHGVGTSILKELSKVCRGSDIDTVMLDVFKVNRRARSFYFAEGFDEVTGIMQKKI